MPRVETKAEVGKKFKLPDGHEAELYNVKFVPFDYQSDRNFCVETNEAFVKAHASKYNIEGIDAAMLHCKEMLELNPDGAVMLRCRETLEILERQRLECWTPDRPMLIYETPE